MPSLPSIALPHRARVLSVERSGPKNALGERQGEPQHGPWFPARRITRRPGREGQRDPGGAGRADKPWALIWGDEHEDGSPLARPPAATDRVEVEVELDTGAIGRYVYEVLSPAADFDAGGGAFGGQAELGEVQEAA